MESKILDIGCGTGGATLTLKKYGTVYAIDYSIAALRYCKERGLYNIINSTVLDLPFKSESFDMITILDTLEHIQKHVEALNQLRCLLKSEGIIVVTVPAFQFLWSKHDEAVSHIRRYNHKNLSDVLRQAGFKKIRLTYFISLIFPLLALYRIVSKFKYTNPKSDLIHLPNGINKMLQEILFTESWLIKRTNFPIGLSLICIAKRR